MSRHFAPPESTLNRFLSDGPPLRCSEAFCVVIFILSIKTIKKSTCLSTQKKTSIAEHVKCRRHTKEGKISHNTCPVKKICKLVGLTRTWTKFSNILADREFSADVCYLFAVSNSGLLLCHGAVTDFLNFTLLFNHSTTFWPCDCELWPSNLT